MSSSSTKNMRGEETSTDPEKGITTKRRTDTTLEQERTTSTTVKETHKIITGTPDELASIIKAEGFNIKEASSGKPLMSSETRKVAYSSSSTTNVSC